MERQLALPEVEIGMGEDRKRGREEVVVGPTCLPFSVDLNVNPDPIR